MDLRHISWPNPKPAQAGAGKNCRRATGAIWSLAREGNVTLNTWTGAVDLLHGPLFSGLVTLGKTRSLAKGDVLFHQDDPGEFVFILVEGLIEISVTSRAGRKSVLAHCGPGEVLGEISVLDGKPRSADAVAIQDSNGTIVWRRDLVAYLSKTPEANMALIEALCGRIRNASDMFATYAMPSASARLAACLLRLAEKWGEEQSGTVEITQPFSQSELGAFAGLARENVNRHLRRWEQDGIVYFAQNTIRIADVDQLRALSDG